MNLTAMITGVSGQDGSYLVEALLAKGYHVIGHVRDASAIPYLESKYPGIELVSFDLNSENEWIRTLVHYQPNHLYHLASMSFIPDCWSNPCLAVDVNLNVIICILEAIRKYSIQTRLFSASSSEIFGATHDSSQNEETPVCPQTTYGVTKAAAYWMIQAYRKRYDLFACNGILYNHESPRRNPRFVTRKISQAVAAIAVGMQSDLSLGNLDACRDWGYAKEYVDCMHLILEQNTPMDFVIGTGKLVNLQSIVEIAFQTIGLEWQRYVVTNQSLVRRNEPQSLVADAGKAKEILNWQASTTIHSVMEMMVHHDCKLLHETRQGKRAA